MKKKLLTLGLIAVMTLSMAACGGGGDEAADPAEKTEFVMTDSEWYGIDTMQLDSTSTGTALVAEPMFSWDEENGTLTDNICTDWTVSEDGLTVTFNVPEGLTFSTGETLDAGDVVASIQHGLDSSPYADGYANIESMDYEGNTVTLHLSHFTSDMMYYFSSGFLTIIDSGELESMSNEELMWGAHPYGPYYIANPEDYVSGSELTLTRFDDFKCENPEVENHGPMAFETIRLRFNVEEFTEIEELKNGTIDMLGTVTADGKMELEGADGITLEEATYPSIYYCELNTDSPVFSDINVRKAFALALDREGWVDIVDGTITPAYSMIFDTMQNFNQEAKDYFEENLANDVDEANKLLDEAGWEMSDDGFRYKDGEKLAFTWYAWTDDTAIAERMAEQLKAVGFEMSIEAIDWNYVYENINSDDYDAGIEYLSWAEPILIFNSCYYDQNAPGNNDEYRALVAETAATIDGEERTELVGDVQMMLFENVNMIPLFSDQSFIAYNSDLKGVNVQPDGTMALNDLSY